MTLHPACVTPGAVLCCSCERGCLSGHGKDCEEAVRALHLRMQGAWTPAEGRLQQHSPVLVDSKASQHTGIMCAPDPTCRMATLYAHQLQLLLKTQFVHAHRYVCLVITKLYLLCLAFEWDV